MLCLLCVILVFGEHAIPDGTHAVTLDRKGIVRISRDGVLHPIIASPNERGRLKSEVVGIHHIILRPSAGIPRTTCDFVFLGFPGFRLTGKKELYLWVAEPSPNQSVATSGVGQCISITQRLKGRVDEKSLKALSRAIKDTNGRYYDLFWSPNGDKVIVWGQKVAFQIDVIDYTLQQVSIRNLPVRGLWDDGHLMCPDELGSCAYIREERGLFRICNLQQISRVFEWPLLYEARSVFGDEILTERAMSQDFAKFLNDKHFLLRHRIVDESGSVVITVGKADVSLSGDGTSVLATQEGHIGLFRFPTGELLAEIEHESEIESAVISKDGQSIGISARIWQQDAPSIPKTTVYDFVDGELVRGHTFHNVDRAFYLSNELAFIRNDKLCVTRSAGVQEYELNISDYSYCALIHDGRVLTNFFSH